MGTLEGRVAVITGAGRGIGREHALLVAREGAKVVVNDLGVANDGAGFDTSPAEQVVAEIRAAGGTAVANADNVATWDGAKRIVEQAVTEFGDLNVVVNNAGILRDAFIASMTEQQWDDVIAVHLKGHAGLLHHAAAYWKARSKGGHPVNASVINTASASGSTQVLPGQTNYAAAKAGILAMTQVAAAELERYGVRVNAITPGARTRLTLATPGIQDLMAKPETGLDVWDPANISPMVAYLAQADCDINGRVFAVQGGQIDELTGWNAIRSIKSDKAWTIKDISAANWN
ncbi:SDR family oxidoreductase [Saccharopolyspora elongata]|uniref:SDR family NAD(P)-dependent oxidoreductase n=1 Tax=Saccharopolyspora elongata TaxID=2530387 RepID=A0A4R4YC63_9PSEU|nr:SDR family oxidoreductase [Saccharopolyspora elongata]TDD42185.1 SDR family NAD(P)-dependent oxidoreductase [Saccharopolyspora elongata]